MMAARKRTTSTSTGKGASASGTAASGRGAAKKSATRTSGDKSAKDPERTRLLKRLGALTLAYVAAGRATPELQQVVHSLRDDVNEWGRRTGSRDLRTRMARQSGGGGGWTCKNCQWIMVSLGRLCFLTECDPEYKMCGYICFTLPREPLPVS